MTVGFQSYELKVEIDRLRAALTRLSSMEAFTLSRVINEEADVELLARIQFAREVIQ